MALSVCQLLFIVSAFLSTVRAQFDVTNFVEKPQEDDLSVVKPKLSNASTPILRVITLNTWESGNRVNDGPRKIANEIQRMDPDVVMLQEADKSLLAYLVHQLGSPWRSCSSHTSFGTFILTKLDIIRSYQPFNGGRAPYNAGCQLRLPHTVAQEEMVNVWNVHLNFENYGPYLFLDTRVQAMHYMLAAMGGQLIKSGRDGRLSEIISFFSHPPVVECIIAAENPDRPVPFILGGDFNEPSHLDWVDSTKRSHFGRIFDWPISRHLHDLYFMDSFRFLHDNPANRTGTTWSPIGKFVNLIWSAQLSVMEPQDRIDYIYLKDPSQLLTIHDSVATVGNHDLQPLGNHSNNAWPSDHAAIVTDFAVRSAPPQPDHSNDVSQKINEFFNEFRRSRTSRRQQQSPSS